MYIVLNVVKRTEQGFNQVNYCRGYIVVILPGKGMRKNGCVFVDVHFSLNITVDL